MLFRVRVQCDATQPESEVWRQSRALSHVKNVTTHAVDPFRRQFGACLTTEGYSDHPFAAFVQELRSRSLQVLTAEKRHQSECEWLQTDIEH